MHVGIAGEVRCVVTKADGTVRLDTGFQKNLILNQGLDFFGGGKGHSLFARCAIGSGNSVPKPTQTQLDAFIATATGTLHSTKYDYVDDGSGLYKTNAVYKYRFTGLGDINIGEVGLVSTGSTSTNYYLCTRAQMKDSSGALTTISLNTGETLDIYYKLWQIFSTADTTHTMNVLDGVGGSVPYKVVCRMAGVGGTNIGGSAHYKDIVGSALIFAAGNNSHYMKTGDIRDIANIPSGTVSWSGSRLAEDTYSVGSYKLKGFLNLNLDQANASNRSFLLLTSMGFYQFRYGSAADDSPIIKTNKDTLSLVFEVSWGRYEGAL